MSPEASAMIAATCHCGSVGIRIPQAPAEVTNCNCSICRRTGALWAYYPFGSVEFEGHPGSTDGYVHGDRTLRLVRCKTCGCVTHWEPLDPQQHPKLGVNIRNFEPAAVGEFRIRLLDGADTWESFFWEDLAPPTQSR